MPRAKLRKIRSRWGNLDKPKSKPEFSYRGVEGEPDKIEFYRGENPFTWGPLKIDRDKARSFVDRMNRIGPKAEAHRRDMSIMFYNEFIQQKDL